MHIKKGNTVKILTGKDKGKTGKVMKILSKKDRVIVEGANIYKKHVRPKKEGEKGEVVEFTASIHVSNIKRVRGDKKTASKKQKIKKTKAGK
tara:strand:- start:3916 stop:4191 length:276 start_codon:yes stop_codon:yes gene_type:complete